MDISPEVSLHEQLYGMGDVALCHAAFEFDGDGERAKHCVLALIGARWAQLMKRLPDGTVEEVRDWECQSVLNEPSNWKPYNESDAPYFLRVTEAGIEAFVNETNFIEKLDQEFKNQK